jgi:hypothetical protein
MSENAWCNASELRLWGALMFSLEEGQGFFRFHPLSNQLVLSADFNDLLVQAAAQRQAARTAPQKHNLHWQKPKHDDVAALYQALLQADNVILRGVSCYLKAFLLWEHRFFHEEMGLNLYIAVEAGLAVLRKRMSRLAAKDVSFYEVFDFVRSTFGEELADYWAETHDDRTILLHPDNRLGAEVFHPQLANDIYELLDPMLSLYRYILLGVPRPDDDTVLRRMQGEEE